MRGYHKNRRRHGVVIVYIIAVLGVMLGFCSLAVDFGRVQTAKTQLRRAVDAAARAGIANLPLGTSHVDSTAIAMASLNKCDGSAVTLTNSNITVGIWNKSTASFGTSGSADNITKFSAVQVKTSQSIPLLFGMVIGKSSCTVNATSIAALVSVKAPITQYVSAHGDPWLAGEPAGTLGSVPDNGYDVPSNNTHPWKYDIAKPGKVDTSSTLYTDSSKVESTDYSTGEPWGSPVEYTVTPGAVIQISVPTDSNNQSTNYGLLDGSGSPSTYADGTGDGSIWSLSDDAANPSLAQGTATTSGSEHGLSNIITPINSMVGVFMDQNGATHGADSAQEAESSVPPGQDFSTQTARDYTSLEPQLNQTFYVGTGQTSSGVTQTIIVPPKAHAIFLGTMDGHEWSNNQGGFNATIVQFNIELVQ